MCDEQDLQKDLTGKCILVTGASGGIGLCCVKQFYKQGATVIMASRNMEKLEKAKEEVYKNISESSGKIELLDCDLEDMNKVKAAAFEAKQRFGKIDILLNNAGVMNIIDREETPQKFEKQIAINYFGHFVLTELLLPHIKEGGRIINTSSCYSYSDGKKRFAKIDIDDLHFQIRPYDGWISYLQSKLANVIHTKDLASRSELQERDITCVSLHPGFVYTELMRYTLSPFVCGMISPMLKMFGGLINVWEGSQTTLHCCLNDSIPSHSGKFFSARKSPKMMYCDRPDLEDGGWPLDRHPGEDSGTIRDRKSVV